VPVVAADAVRRELAQGKPRPVYLLVGDDARGVDELVAAFAALVDEDARAVDVERFYADERPEEAAIAAVQAARTLPMLGARRIVVLLRAERLLTAKGRRGADAETGGAEAASAAVLDYLERPAPHATLVVVAADVHRTLRLAKALYARAAVVECWGLKDGREVKGWELEAVRRKAERWARDRTAAAGKRLEADALGLLAARAGPDLGRLRADVERLLLFAGDRRELTRADVEAVVGPETSQDAWAVTTALEAGRTGEALKALALLLEAGTPPVLVLGQLAWVARERLAPAHPDRARAIFDALLRTDLALKSSGGDPRILLERLVVELGGPTVAGARRRTPGPPSRAR
jgi:DNA polymerase-3 subunit delta